MSTDAAPRTYSGVARVLDRNGLLIDVGKAELSTDANGDWAGTLSVFRGSSLAAKHLTGLVELADGSRALATVGPKTADLEEDLIVVAVHGVGGTVPF